MGCPEKLDFGALRRNITQKEGFSDRTVFSPLAQTESIIVAPRSCIPKSLVHSSRSMRGGQQEHGGPQREPLKLDRFDSRNPYGIVTEPAIDSARDDDGEDWNSFKFKTDLHGAIKDATGVDYNSKSMPEPQPLSCSPDRGAKRFQINLAQPKSSTNWGRNGRAFEEIFRRKFVFKTFGENVAKRGQFPATTKATKKPLFMTSRPGDSRICLPKGSPKPLKELKGLYNLRKTKCKSFNGNAHSPVRDVNEYNFPEIGDIDSEDSRNDGYTEDANTQSTRTLFN